MKSNRFPLSDKLAAACFVLLCCASAGGQTPAPTDEKALRELDAQWSAAAEARDLEKVLSFYAADAVVMPSNAPTAKTKDAIRTIWKDLITSPNYTSWTATDAEVAKSGDIAYVSGTYEAMMNDISGQPVRDIGKYLEIFKKQSDGSWKCAVDIWNSDLPLHGEKK